MPSLKRCEDLALVLPLAGAGALVGHGLGYGAVTPVGHGYVAVVGPLLTVLAGAALAVGAVRSLRSRDLRLSAGVLAVAQAIIYALVETTEHTVGVLDLAGLLSPEVLLGLVAQLPVAWLLSRLFRLAEVVVARLARRRSCKPATPLLSSPGASVRPVGRLLARPGPPRGPPRLVVV